MKKISRRSVLVAAGMSVVALALTACGSSSTASSSAASGSADAQAITALDEGEQEELYKRALTILSEQAASVWLQDLCDLTVMSPKLTGLELYRTYVLDMSTIRYAE